MRLAGWAAPLLAALLVSCANMPQQAGTLPTPGHPGFTPVAFAQLPGWADEHPAQAIPPLLLSCARFAASAPTLSLGGDGEAARMGGQAGQWTRACQDARALAANDDASARAFFERDFQPYAITATTGAEARFTGYYEPELRGARTRGALFQVPLYGRPPDLVQVDLSDFRPDLKGSVTGRVADGRLVPYFDRTEIESGALGNQRPLLWLADPVDAFFLQVQGSGRVVLPDGDLVRVGYAAKNGRPYVAIGKVLAARGDLPANQVSMQSIRAWLAAHPDQVDAVLDQNPSFVFFRLLDNVPPDLGAPGALGVPLTPGRSVAVDRGFIPLGAPLYIATTDPVGGTPLRRVVLAQDLGSAVSGPLGVDIFFGWGQDAGARAGRMDAGGAAYVLLPKALPAP